MTDDHRRRSIHGGAVARSKPWLRRLPSFFVRGPAGYLPRGKLDEAAKLFGIEYGTARNAATVCRKFERYLRKDHLTFTHHAIVANHPEADELLTWAADTGATVRGPSHLPPWRAFTT